NSYGRTGLFPNDYYEEIPYNNNNNNNNKENIVNYNKVEEEIKVEESFKEYKKIGIDEGIKIILNQILNKIKYEKYKKYMNSNIFKERYKRLFLIKEIYETEKTYIDFLKEIKVEYIDPIKNDNILE